MEHGIKPPRHIVWSTSEIDPGDPFQHRWLLQQTLIHGKADDIRQLDFNEIAEQFDDLLLPEPVQHLWRSFLKTRYE